MEHTLLTIWGFLAYMAFWSLTPIKFWCFKSISLDNCYVGNICTNIHGFKAGRAGWNRAGFKKIGEGKNPDDLVKNPGWPGDLARTSQKPSCNPLTIYLFLIKTTSFCF